MEAKRVLFIDRDGTILLEPPTDYQIDAIEKFSFFPEAISSLKKISRETDYELVLVSNQDGLGTEHFPTADFEPYQKLMIDTLKSEGVEFYQIHIDPSLPKEKSPNRKPQTGMLTAYFDKEQYDLKNSFVIGDRETDIQLAQNLGAKAIRIAEKIDVSLKKENPNLELETEKWSEIVDLLLQSQQRVSFIHRKTKETDIEIGVNLDGSGKSQIQTGISFFDHMLEQLSKHGDIDLKIKVQGDLEVDEHHTIEDTALALGNAFREALGNKKGINRYGFLLPMDDCLAQVAIDFSGRPWTVWDASFKREKIGNFPTEMFFHFFKSFSDASQSNINIKAEGSNEHHKIEAIFKAFAKAVKTAVAKDEKNSGKIPSTKGVL